MAKLCPCCEKKEIPDSMPECNECYVAILKEEGM